MPAPAAGMFAQAGWDALTVRDQGLTSASDDQIATVVSREQRILVTLDLDFADIRHFPPDRFAGIIVIRPGINSRQAVLAAVERISGLLLQSQSVAGQLWVVESHRVRVRET